MRRHLAVFAVGLVAITLTAKSVAQPDRVAYTTSRPGNWDIYLFPGGGKPPERLTTDVALDYDPTVSPDGRWLVFCSERRGSPDLFVLDLEKRGEPRLLIESDALEDQAAFSPDGKTLAFVATASGNAEIYTLAFRPSKTATMRDAANITRSPGGDFRPAFSPDGKTLAFSSDRDLPATGFGPAASITRSRTGAIYTRNLETGAQTRLTTPDTWNGSPSWSSDGKSIAFYSDRGFGPVPPQHASVWVMNADGSNQRELTSIKDFTALSPEFLPNGRIVYAKRMPWLGPQRGGNQELYAPGVWQIVTIANDGSDERVESAPSQENFWEPTRGPTAGSFIAHGTTPNVPGAPIGTDVFGAHGAVLVEGAPFRAELADRTIELYPLRYFSAVLNPRTDALVYDAPADPTTLFVSSTSGAAQRSLVALDPPQLLIAGFAGFQWSRDGTKVGFTRGDRNPLDPRGGEGDIWIVGADGASLTNVTPSSAGYDGYPSFAADGRIAFRSRRSGHYDVFTMNGDGSNVRQITDDDANDLFPNFAPDGSRIAFVSNRGNPSSDLYDVWWVDVARDGAPGGVHRITDTNAQEGHLAFSYDGEWLIFSSEQAGISDEEPLLRAVQFAAQAYGEMFAYRIADGTTVRLTHNKWEEGVPSWEAALPR